MTTEIPLILVVDDESLLRSILTRMLERLGYKSVAVHSAEAAMAVLQSQSFELALLDISLPGKSGVELLEHMSSTYPDTAAIMVTGAAEVNTVLRTIRVGAYDYVTKPYKEEELAAAIGRALERRRLLFENREYQRTLEQLIYERSRAMERAIEQLGQTYDQTIRALGAALDLRDTETEDHCVRVADYAVRLATAMGIDDEATLRNLKWGAYLHDIGKIGIPDSILLKPDLLTDSEYSAIKEHPELGYRMLNRIPFLKKAAEVVYQHHEEFAGSGYPRGLSGDEIAVVARIFAVADAVDAMTSRRPYRKPLGWDEVRAELRAHSGNQFDPGVIDAFLSVPSEDWEAIRIGSYSPATDGPALIGTGA